MKNVFAFILMFQISFGFAQAGNPASPFYDGFDFNQTGIALKNALSNNVISTHQNLLTYQQAENAIKIIDLDPDDFTNTNLLLVYGSSENMCPQSTIDFVEHRRRRKFDDGTNSCEWNREHTFPKSLGNPDLGTDGPGSDVHHLRASDVSKNANRGNLKFNNGSGFSGNTGGFWYPGDEWKGDIARMMMYMYLRYGEQCLPIYVGVGNTVDNDSNMIDLFLQWNAEDPVSEVEDNRNTYLGNLNNAYGQGNRNPFIDNPILATAIWGGVAAENRWPNYFLNTTAFDLSNTITVYPNPTQDNHITISSNNTLDSIQLINVNGQLIQEIQKPTAVNHNYSLANLPKGFYLLKISANNQTAIKKVLVN
jgi:endonuclease I